MPNSIKLSCNFSAKAIHLLSGVGGYCFPIQPKGSVSMIVRLTYTNGAVENHELLNGEHFADYITRHDVPGSQFAFAMRNQQMRYMSITPKRTDRISLIELVKGSDKTAPLVMAVTLEEPPAAAVAASSELQSPPAYEAWLKFSNELRFSKSFSFARCVERDVLE